MEGAIGASRGRVVESEFEPHPWLRSAHAQTAFPALFRPLPRIELRIERLELPDGDFVDLGWSGDPRAKRVAILIHGLTGGFLSKYLRGLSQQLTQRNWRTVVLQLRGGGATPNRLARCYHHGDTGDLRHLWQLLRAREPDVQLAAVGWSLGANVLLKALGEEGAAAPLAAAAAACAPLRLEACALKLRSGSARVYQNRLLRDLKAIVTRKHQAVPVPAHVDIDRVLRATDFIEFDDAYTAPMNGFADARDYYRRCESGAFLHAIRRPTLIVNARDDPFMTSEILPSADALAPAVTLELSRRGGHVGFVAAGARGEPRFWLEQHLAQWLERAVPPASPSAASPVIAQ